MINEINYYRIWCETENQYVMGFGTNEPTTCPSNNTHTIDQSRTAIIETITNTNKKNKDGALIVENRKSFIESDKSFVSPEYHDKTTWYYTSTRVENEIMTTSDNIVYNSINNFWINLKKIPKRDEIQDKRIIVKKNDNEIEDGFTIDYENGQIIFNSANDISDVITVSYNYAINSEYYIIPNPGKKILLDQSMLHVSKGCLFPDNFNLHFVIIYCGPAIPAPYNIPENIDAPVKIVHYTNANDFLVTSHEAYVIPPFGNLTKDTIRLVWNYLSGYTIKPPEDPTTDLSKNEFNKLMIVSNNNLLVTNTEISSASFFCRIEDI